MIVVGTGLASKQLLRFAAKFEIVRSYEPGILRIPHQHRTPLSRFCLQVFSWTGPPRRVDCMAPMGNQRKESFPRIQRQNARFEQ